MQSKYKYTIKNYIIALALFVTFGLAFWLIIDYESTPTDIATDAQVWNVLETSGYVPYDVTEKRLEKEPQCGILKSIITQKEDVQIEFHVFKSDKRAQSVWAKYYSYIRGEEFNPRSQTGRGNRVIYQTIAQGKYYVIVRVGNTISFATSASENAGDINSFLISIGYLESSKPSKLLGNEVKYVIAIFMYIIVLLPLTRLSLRWIWKLICKSAEITSKDLDLYEEETKHRFSFESTRYGYFSQRVKNPKKFKLMYLAYKVGFLPLYIAIFMNFISIFIDVNTFNPDKFGLAAILIIIGSGFIEVLYERIYLPLNK